MKPCKRFLLGLEECHVVPLGKIGDDLRYECGILSAAKDRTLFHERSVLSHVFNEDEDSIRCIAAGECGEISEEAKRSSCRTELMFEEGVCDRRVCTEGVESFGAEVTVNRNGELPCSILVYGEHSAVHILHYTHHLPIWCSRFIHHARCSYTPI